MSTMKIGSLPTPSRGWKKKAVVLLLQLIPATWALIYPRIADLNPSRIDGYDGPMGNHSKTLLSARQDASIGGGTPMGLDCMYRCTLATCGGGTCPLRRRGLRYPDIEAHTEGNETSILRKRLFWDDHVAWTAKDIDLYVWSNVGYNFADPQFQVRDWLINDLAEKTVAAQRIMAGDGNSFAIGTNHVHGCTVVAIISNRAVWMAHFWERAMGTEGDGFRT
ncbi:hypothetical protein QBC40DRAFT_21275 [Triangularia verruculosa]|uniref:Uncharacterized protein n=1 Tax=Triangularia verruculosa TaxID=2587418 RepID=A0AAN6XTR6_9PEZI|nr:hypothetical protein QBC40DRAFT_21275 [Triangularia verruculosa]